MRLFISYARIDKPFCLQIIDTLDVHDIWYDQRLYAGQRWWPEIQRRLAWCDGFVYLLSPDSVASKYCRDEYKIACDLGKHIFPVLIHEGTPLSEELGLMQYADFSQGVTPEAVKTLLSSIYLTEKKIEPTTSPDNGTPTPIVVPKLPEINPATVVGEAALALEKGNFDQAVFLLRQAKEIGYKPRFIDLDALLKEAEIALERQTRMREAEREYKQIAALVKYETTRVLGCESFTAFHEQYPEYDPENLAIVCDSLHISVASVLPKKVDFTLPLLDWCDIPAGMVTIEIAGKNGHSRHMTFHVEAFEMSKYPVTNAQFQAFVEDPEGYTKAEWWDYSHHARDWRGKNPHPKPPRFKGDDRPRENVTWYEAVAFTRWLSTKLAATVCLPTEQQWQRAVQGDDGRLYPWGNDFDPSRCNTSESRIRMTTFVSRYPNGVNPQGVFDLSGNVWEWCLNTNSGHEDHIDITSNGDRAVHGGSFIGVCERAQAPFRFYLSPNYFYATIGFRLVRPASGVG